VLADRIGIIDHGLIVAEGTPAALKAEIGRPTIEALPADGTENRALEQILERFGELQPSTAGVAVRLDGQGDLADVVRALDSAQLGVAELHLHAPTLDDVFLAKTGRSLEGSEEPSEPEPE
jgi:ABC-2 type transport system ATP-binding protein